MDRVIPGCLTIQKLIPFMLLLFFGLHPVCTDKPFRQQGQATWICSIPCPANLAFPSVIQHQPACHARIMGQIAPETHSFVVYPKLKRLRTVCETRLSLRWLMPIAVATVCLLTGCSTVPDSQNSAWLGEDDYTYADATQTLDPITAVAASQHPLTRQALKHLGIHYKFGGTSPETGFDCSGLVHYSAKKSLGLTLPRQSSQLARTGKAIKKQQLAVGDLVFFNTRGSRYSHVGIYLGNNLFVHAPSSGGKVRVENMTSPYWKKRFTGARRIETDAVMLASSKP